MAGHLRARRSAAARGRKLSGELNKAIDDPEMKAKLVAQGIEPSGLTLAELGVFQKSEIDKWLSVIKVGTIKIE